MKRIKNKAMLGCGIVLLFALVLCIIGIILHNEFYLSFGQMLISVDCIICLLTLNEHTVNAKKKEGYLDADTTNN